MPPFLMRFLNRSHWKFQWLYFRGQTPWDTQVTPPEVLEFIAGSSPGQALDLGCGTGTNAITLARHGWQVTGVDFVTKAIRTARRKAAAAGLQIDFHSADVTALEMLAGPYDYALDIGCLFSLDVLERIKYTQSLGRLLRPQGWYMLYAWLPRPWKGKMAGMTPAEVEALLSPNFVKRRTAIGEEKGHPSAWYWFQRAGGAWPNKLEGQAAPAKKMRALGQIREKALDEQTGFDYHQVHDSIASA